MACLGYNFVRSESLADNVSIVKQLDSFEKVFAITFLALLGFCCFGALRVSLTPDPSSIRTHELSNIKQCATATLIYASDNDDKFPVSSHWMDCALPYTKGHPELFIDVLNDKARAPDKNESVESGKYGTAFNLPLSAMALNKIDKPENSVLLFTSTIMGWNATSGLETANPFTVYGGKRRLFVTSADSSGRSIAFGDISHYDRATGALKPEFEK